MYGKQFSINLSNILANKRRHHPLHKIFLMDYRTYHFDYAVGRTLPNNTGIIVKLLILFV